MSTKSHSSSPAGNTSNSSTPSFHEQRRKFIQAMYNHHNGHSHHHKEHESNPDHSTTNIQPINASKTLLNPSSTSHAASDSFIKDSHSPLFNAIDHRLHHHILHKFPPFSINSKSKNGDNIQIKKRKSMPPLNKSKSFTVTPPNSPKKRLRGRSKSSESLPSLIPTMEELKIEQDQINQPKLTPSSILNGSKESNDGVIKRQNTNIHQKEDIIPPKKMKKQATTEELHMVLDHFQIAHDKDIELLLKENEPHVIKYRDEQYAKAKAQGITASSNDRERLKVLGDVINFTYMNIEPPNEYTKQTDRKHFKEVGAWTAKFAKDKGIVPSVCLIYSAWCHDIERFIPATKCEYLPEAVDKYRKQVIHGVTSAKVATCLLKGAPVTQEEIHRVYELVLHHDIPHPREDIVILDEKLVAAVDDDIMWELELLMDADAFAFFQSTIRYFILFKSKKNSPDWIWERVRNNVKRLRPYLRPKAAECIKQLPQDILSKVNIDYIELNHLCSDSGKQSTYSTAPPSVEPSPNTSFIKEEQKKLCVGSDGNPEIINNDSNISYISTDNFPIKPLEINQSNASQTSQTSQTTNEYISESEHCELTHFNDNKNI